MKAAAMNSNVTQMAACVAPEDLKGGDYVAMLNVVYEIPSFLWCCDSAGIPVDEPVQIRFRAPEAGVPLKVQAICLPFVFVKSPKGERRTVDVRQVQLVRLTDDYAKAVWKEIR